MKFYHVDVNPAALRGSDMTESGALPCMPVVKSIIHKQMWGRMLVYAKHDCMPTEDINTG